MTRQARVAVVLRRGPSKQVLLVRWDLTDDSFEAGQWLTGRIYDRRCDLSPRGDHFLYFWSRVRTLIDLSPQVFEAREPAPGANTWTGPRPRGVRLPRLVQRKDRPRD
jgi:hypothetical protein